MKLPAWLLISGFSCLLAVAAQAAEPNARRADSVSAEEDAKPGDSRPPVPAQADSTAAARKLIDQKMEMVRRAVAESRLASRVAGEGDTPGKAALLEAAGLIERAKGMLAANDLHAAERQLDLAIWALVRALQHSPARADEALQGRYEEMDRTLMSLQAAYIETHARVASDGEGSADEAVEQSRALAGQARQAATDGQFSRAIQLLEQAQHDMLVRHRRLLGRDTVLYTLVFDKPEDEFRYELARSRDYQRLIPIALREYRPDAGARQVVEREQQQGQVRLSEAVGAAAAGRPQDAIRMLGEATNQFRRALVAAGLDLPVDMPTQPATEKQSNDQR